MTESQTILTLKNEYSLVLDNFKGKVLIPENFNREDTYKKMKAISKHTQRSFTLFDLNEKRYVFHKSVYNSFLKHPAVNTAAVENHLDFLQLTHPDDVAFCLKAEINIYTALHMLSIEQQEEFNAVYISRMENKEGKYEVYKHRFFVLFSGIKNRPWLIAIETKRLNVHLLTNFTPILYIKPMNTSILPYDEILLKEDLTKTEKIIFSLIIDGFRYKEISNRLLISLNTVKNHCAGIMRKTNTHSLTEARIVGKIMGVGESA